MRESNGYGSNPCAPLECLILVDVWGGDDDDADDGTNGVKAEVMGIETRGLFRRRSSSNVSDGW